MDRPFDPLNDEEREAQLAKARPRMLPVAPHAPPARRRLPLAGEVRDADRRWRPIYAVWEITLKCDGCRSQVAAPFRTLA